MLTPPEVAKIRSEERLRSDLRKEFALASPPPPPASPRDRLWKALNSNFVLWVLSAVLLSGISTAYTRYQTRTREAAQAHEAKALEAQRISELMDRLNLEISFRLSSALSRLHDLSTSPKAPMPADADAALAHALKPLGRPMSDTFPPLFPEFASYSGLALIAELRRHVGAGEQKILTDTLAHVSRLIYDTFEERRRARPPRDVARDLLKHMNNPKWDNGFPYTDCTEANPFC